MILEATRLIAAALADATYGVNATLDNAPTDTGVTEAPAVTVLNSTTDGRVARGGVPNLEPSEFPALLVTPNDAPVDQMSPGVRPWPPDATVTVLIRYACHAIDTAKCERDTSQTIRAVWRCLGQLMQQPANGRARTMAQVALVSIRSMQAATLYESSNDTLVTGGVLVTCHMLDFWTQS